LTLVNQLGEPALFRYTAILKYNNVIERLYGIQPMGDCNNGPSGKQGHYVFHHGFFR
jgi:hypothetical protein